jgi:hypothetical protein
VISDKPIWLTAGLRTPFVNVDGPLAARDSLALSVPAVHSMAPLAKGPIDFAVRAAVAVNLAYANLGHPFGATGARILSQAVKELAAMPKGSRAIVSICADGGLGTVALLEN